MASRLEDNKVSTQYARALFDEALAQDELEEILDDLRNVEAVVDKVPELMGFLTNPGIPSHEKMEFVQTQFHKKVHPMILNLLKLMVENDRFTAFPGLVARFQDLINKHEQVGTAELITAVEIGKALENKMKKALETLYGFKKVEITKRVDPGILGGAIVKIQDQVIDGSFIGKLETIRKQAG